MTVITGKDLLKIGFEGAELGAALNYVNSREWQAGELSQWLIAHKPAPKLPLQGSVDYAFNIRADNDFEAENVAKVKETMDAVMRTPTVCAGAIMPDACPAGPVGTIPVGGVVATENAIHPGMHSADICCSVMVTEFKESDPKTVLDAIHSVTHFGPGGRPNGKRFTVSLALLDAFRENAFLSDKKIVRAAQEHMGTQGDGNHFAYVGVSKANGTTCLVTHHGSRGPGAGLYKLGMRIAEKFRKKLSPATLKQNAWIPFETEEGQAYWEALQLIRKWTKANHNALQQAALEVSGGQVKDRFWNEHNFVFRKDALFYHAKGATPVDTDLLPDTNGVQIVPLNMGEPILLIKGGTTPQNLGFAPHGAGRNYARSAHKRAHAGLTDAEIFAAETAHIDARFFCEKIDISELPSAYKPAATVRTQMADFGLADVVDEIQPYGCIMAGDWEYNAPWKVKARAKHAAKDAALR